MMLNGKTLRVGDLLRRLPHATGAGGRASCIVDYLYESDGKVRAKFPPDWDPFAVAAPVHSIGELDNWEICASIGDEAEIYIPGDGFDEQREITGGVYNTTGTHWYRLNNAKGIISNISFIEGAFLKCSQASKWHVQAKVIEQEIQTCISILFDRDPAPHGGYATERFTYDIPLPWVRITQMPTFHKPPIALPGDSRWDHI